MRAPGGTLILYATRPGETASDAPEGRNGLFTGYLLEVIDDPGVEVEDAFKRAGERVYEASGGRQDPWMEGRIRGQFYFRPPPGGGERQAQAGPAGGQGAVVSAGASARSTARLTTALPI